MAKKTKVATLKKKRTKKKPLCYVDKKGNVRHRKGGRREGKGSVLEKNVVGKDLLKARKAGKIILFLRGKVGKKLSVWKVKSGLLGKKKRKGKKRKMKRRKAKVKAKGKKRGRKRKVGRPKLSPRKKKSSRCPKTRKAPTQRSAKACIRRGKGTSIAKRKVYNQAVRKLRKSKAGRKWLSENKIKMAKASKKRKKARRRKRGRRRRR